MPQFFGSALAYASGVGSLAALLVVLYFTQDRAAGVGRFLRGCFRAFVPAARAVQRYVRRRRSERAINRILAAGTRDRPFLASKIELQWQDPSVSRDAFFREKRFVVHIARNFDRDESLIETVFLFVSRSLLVGVKRFLSDDQRQALNLYFTARILESTSVRLGYQFSTEYVHDKLSDNSSLYLSIFHALDRYALLEDIFLREMEYLGTKVVAQDRAPAIESDVDAFITQLHSITEREHGEATSLTLERMYIRSAIVLAGKSQKIKKTVTPYVDYIEGSLVPREIDTVYLLGSDANRSRLKAIAEAVSSNYKLVRTRSRKGTIAGRQSGVIVLELRGLNAGILSNAASFGLASALIKPSALSLIEARSPDGKLTGTVKFLTPEGWGFIKVDDPAVPTDAWFDRGAVVDAPILFGADDRVTFTLVRENRGPRAYDIRVILSSRHETDDMQRRPLDEGTSEEIATVIHNTETQHGAGGVAVIQPVGHAAATDVSLDDVSEAIVGILIDRQVGLDPTPVSLATVGHDLRKRIVGFSHYSTGHSSLLAMVTAIASSDPRLTVSRDAAGLPFVTLTVF